MEINVYGDLYVTGNEKDTVQRKQSIRSSPAYLSMKKRVKSRDKVCQICGEVDVNGHLEIHHILPFREYPELACDDNNCICLCQHHHSKYHDLYDGCENAVTFVEYVKKTMEEMK